MRVIEEAQPRVATCAWCGAPLDGSAVRLRGRTQCPACGAATTDPWPSEEQLRQAYGSWYRPESGAVRLHRRRRCCAGPARCWRVASIGSRRPGPVLDVGAGEGVLIDALRRRGREAIGLERDSRRPGRARRPARGGRGRVGRGRLLALAGAPSGSRRGDPRGCPAPAARRRGRDRGPEHGQPSGTGVRRPLAAPGPAPPSRPPVRNEPCARRLDGLRASRWSASRTSAVGRS